MDYPFKSLYIYTCCQTGCRRDNSVIARARGDADRENWKTHVEAEIGLVSRCSWMARSSNSEMHLEAESELMSEVHVEAVIERP